MSEEKEPKPKKLFQITITVWDDLEIDSEMHEFRDNPSGRGRPGKWRLTASEFVKRVEEVAGDYDALSAEWNKAIGKGVKELLGMTLMQRGSSSVAITKVETPTVKETEKPQEEKKSKKEKNKDETKKDDDYDQDLNNFTIDPE